MVLDPAAIDEFLTRDLDSHVWMKTLAESKVDKALADLTPQPVFKTPLMLHQKVCFLLGLAYPEFFFMLDMGTGKTLVILSLLEYFMRIGTVNKALALVPLDEAVWGWEEQVVEHTHGLPYACLTGSSEDKWRKYGELDKGLAIVSYMGLVHMLSGRKVIKVEQVVGGRVVGKEAKKTGTGRDAHKLEPNISKIEKFCNGLQMLTLDESTKVSNHSSLPYRVCNQLSKRTDYRYALAGRPFGRDPTPIWAQYFLLDRGNTLGPTLGLFRGVFFTEKRGYFGGFEYTFEKRMAEDLSRTIAHRSLQYMADECIALPPDIRIVKKVSFPIETEAYYKKTRDAVIAARGNYREVENIFLRMRQISSGFLGFKDDETGDKAHVEFEDNPKLNLLLEMVRELPPDRKFIVFYEYTYSGRRIHEALGDSKVKAKWIWSGTKDSKADIARFKADPKTRGLVLQNIKGAYSLNLQVANYAFFYESPVSVIDREQAERRILRQGQVFDKVFLIDLVVKGSVDEKILKFHKEGKDLFEMLRQNSDELAYD